MNADFFHEGQSKDKSVDYAISFDIETSKYIVDIFDAAITDADEVYIESVEYRKCFQTAWIKCFTVQYCLQF